MNHPHPSDGRKLPPLPHNRRPTLKPPPHLPVVVAPRRTSNTGDKKPETKEEETDDRNTVSTENESSNNEQTSKRRSLKKRKSKTKKTRTVSLVQPPTLNHHAGGKETVIDVEESGDKDTKEGSTVITNVTAIIEPTNTSTPTTPTPTATTPTAPTPTATTPTAPTALFERRLKPPDSVPDNRATQDDKENQPIPPKMGENKTPANLPNGGELPKLEAPKTFGNKFKFAATKVLLNTV